HLATSTLNNPVISQAPLPRSVYFFFFQAEDGIRVGHVTGVQTCALPISPSGTTLTRSGATSRSSTISRRENSDTVITRRAVRARSEERRVGKECRARWSP